MENIISYVKEIVNTLALEHDVNTSYETLLFDKVIKRGDDSRLFDLVTLLKDFRLS